MQSVKAIIAFASSTMLSWCINARAMQFSEFITTYLKLMQKKVLKRFLSVCRGENFQKLMRIKVGEVDFFLNLNQFFIVFVVRIFSFSRPHEYKEWMNTMNVNGQREKEKRER